MSNVNILLARPIEESNLSMPSCLSTRMDWVGSLEYQLSFCFLKIQIIFVSNGTESNLKYCCKWGK